MNKVFEAAEFAYQLHSMQKRKFTNNHYVEHLAEVVGLFASAYSMHSDREMVSVGMITAWLHDSIEDQGDQVTIEVIEQMFGSEVAKQVSYLTEPKEGKRVDRVSRYITQLAKADEVAKAVKICDMISNVKSVIEYSPNFAKTYLVEKRNTLEAMSEIMYNDCYNLLLKKGTLLKLCQKSCIMIATICCTNIWMNF